MSLWIVFHYCYVTVEKEEENDLKQDCDLSLQQFSDSLTANQN